MSLETYRRKRHFEKTTEPRGKSGQRKKWGFSVQRHGASHLHYDLRLALDGVLKSWAIPKGPSLDPANKRLAVEVEDHPLEYADFEGTIPEGEYGAGSVMLWDSGTWRPDGDPHQGLREGKLEFHLEGKKLRGGWVLVRSKQLASRGKNTWLLIKRRDAEVRRGADDGILKSAPRSVKTGRDQEEIAAGRNTRPRKAAKIKGAANAKSQKSRPAGAPEKIAGARVAKLPDVFQPQLATLTDHPPDGASWWNETKLDGYRIAVLINDGKVDLLSRRMQSWTARLPHLVGAARALTVRSAVLDGELVALQSDGSTNFQALQTAFKENRAAALVYFAFDLLYLDGHDLTAAPLDSRKEALAKIVPPGGNPQGIIRYCQHTAGRGPECFEEACTHGQEGIVCKRRDAPYVAGRGDSWLKVKCLNEQEFVIGGYTDPEGSRKNIGALLLGYYTGRRLAYAGRVGTGFSASVLADLAKRLKRLQQSDSPFASPPVSRRSANAAHWVKPALVAQIQFKNWTREGLLRQPSFQGLREDKDPRDVTREEPADPAAVTRKRSPPRRRSTNADTQANGNGSAGRKKAAAGTDLARLGIAFTHPDKVLYPDTGIRKVDLAKYYLDIAEWILPHITDRPLTLVRCPDGEGGECFFQKHAGKGRLDHLRLIPIREHGKTADYLVADDPLGLLSLVQMGVLEIHVWGSRCDGLERPDRMIFDLDPDIALPWSRVVESALQLKQFFDDLGLQSFVKTTGGKGLHIVVPLARRQEWPEVAEFCKDVAETVANGDPARYTSKSSKALRPGKIFLDYLRNNRGATSVAPYSTRARPGAPVSVPLAWDEVTADMRSDKFNITNLAKRLASISGDPWQGIDQVRQMITAAIKKKLRQA